jgi:cytochrome c peroxidase
MTKLHLYLFYIGALLLSVAFAAAPRLQAQSALDAELREVLRAQKITPLSAGPEPALAKVALGRALFWDKLLSGNRDIACATCHHPSAATGDAQPLSIGTGGRGLGADRVPSQERARIPRHAPELFNRGQEEWNSMFWDSRVARGADGSFASPAGAQLPQGLDNPLAVQALFPLLSPEEMRGVPGDADVFGRANELAALPGDNPPAVWAAIMRRVLANERYRELFAQAYPGVPHEQLGIQHAANAIAAFEASAFTLLNSPWDRYVAGQDAALSDAAKRGALLFYGPARCASCHSGNLFTNQQHHNIGVPQLGPGRGSDAPLDLGRAGESGNPAERFAFRTPPLRNVALTAPYMHNGAYPTLDAAVRHYLNPPAALRAYDPAQHLPPSLAATVQRAPAQLDAVLATLDPLVTTPLPLGSNDIDDLLAFLEALTDPAARDLSATTPADVPSGLPVAENETPVEIQGFAFAKRELAVPVGTTVRWTNRDAVPHTIVSQQAGLFQSGDLTSGQSFAQRFDTPGTYQYVCSIHTFMTGTVTVQGAGDDVFLPLIAR